MAQKLRTLALIPARGGSRGIYRKNIQDLGGLPLLAYSILMARTVRGIDRVIVSTDDEEIAALARAHGAETPFLRPREIAGSRAIIGDAVGHALKHLRGEGYVPDAVLTLYPTHPFRSAHLVESVLGRLAQGYATIVTANPLPGAGQRCCTLDGENRLRPAESAPSPELPGLRAYRPYGLVVGQSYLPTAYGIYLEPLRPGIECIDIDDPEDLALARAVVRAGSYRLEGSCAG